MSDRERNLGIIPLILVFILIIPMAAYSAEKKVVRVWHTETEPQTIAAVQEIINDYEKLHPDVTVKQEGLAWGDLEAKLTAALAAHGFAALGERRDITPEAARRILEAAR